MDYIHPILHGRAVTFSESQNSGGLRHGVRRAGRESPLLSLSKDGTCGATNLRAAAWDAYRAGHRFV